MISIPKKRPKRFLMANPKSLRDFPPVEGKVVETPIIIQGLKSTIPQVVGERVNSSDFWLPSTMISDMKTGTSWKAKESPIFKAIVAGF